MRANCANMLILSDVSSYELQVLFDGKVVLLGQLLQKLLHLLSHPQEAQDLITSAPELPPQAFLPAPASPSPATLEPLLPAPGPTCVGQPAATGHQPPAAAPLGHRPGDAAADLNPEARMDSKAGIKVKPVKQEQGQMLEVRQPEDRGGGKQASGKLKAAAKHSKRSRQDFEVGDESGR